MLGPMMHAREWTSAVVGKRLVLTTMIDDFSRAPLGLDSSASQREFVFEKLKGAES